MPDLDAPSVEPVGQDGWAGLADGFAASSSSFDLESQGRLEVAFARSFAGEDGERILAHLRTITLGRALGPEASDAALRHLDGQRCLYLHIQSLIERGRSSQ